MNINHGHDNAITANELSVIYDKNKRDVRRSIEKLRNNGVVIINNQDGQGYYQPTDEDIIRVKQHYLQEKSRADSILAPLGAERAWLLERGVELG